jgi:hypothetical protein
MEQHRRRCRKCGTEIPEARLQALPETLVCVACSRSIGGEFELEVTMSGTGKAGSLKITGQQVSVQRKRKPLKLVAVAAIVLMSGAALDAQSRAAQMVREPRPGHGGGRDARGTDVSRSRPVRLRRQPSDHRALPGSERPLHCCLRSRTQPGDGPDRRLATAVARGPDAGARLSLTA